MKRSLSLLLGLAALAMAAPQADARDGCGRGWFYNGQACVQQEQEEGQRYYNDAPMYAPQRSYDDRDYRGYQPAPRGWGPPRPIMGANGQISCNNPNYTWQDGACKPYRGPR